MKNGIKLGGEAGTGGRNGTQPIIYGGPQGLTLSFKFPHRVAFRECRPPLQAQVPRFIRKAAVNGNFSPTRLLVGRRGGGILLGRRWVRPAAKGALPMLYVFDRADTIRLDRRRVERIRKGTKFMSIVKLSGNVDENRRLSAQVPASVRPCPVTVFVLPEMREDDEARDWTAGIALEWADELADPSQDIYTMADGKPVCES